jgi:hypothetical protein
MPAPADLAAMLLTLLEVGSTPPVGTMSEKTCIVFVAYYRTGNYDWTKIVVSSFREVFGDRHLIVVDQNFIPEERLFLRENNVEIWDGEGTTHSDGLDLAVSKAKQEGYERIVFIDPDCVFTSKVWYDNLIDALDEGYYMAGVNCLCGGIIIPCGTAWVLDKIPTSFCVTTKAEEIKDPIFHEIIDLDAYVKHHLPNVSGSRNLFFHIYTWDCGMRNWYLLRKIGKAKLVDDSGFRHYGQSMLRTPQEVLNSNEHLKELLVKYVEMIAEGRL